jgi:hypothetical protein
MVLNVPLPIFEQRPFNVFGALAKRIHLLRRKGLELLGNANIILQLTDRSAPDGNAVDRQA